ncbi:MAG: acyl-CoA dehydrogenase, middle domain protein 15 [Rhodospirillales bacterium]|jgi:acyl-CoA dehydrogenase|nr:acyl-CoA dehydrogenase, middle domain protein 15 [Rhodospirillales bacterium]MDB5384144.1 acyl-CoA dehydrogenase, middle domain protein 15 [Rhodospirillales bacterium]
MDFSLSPEVEALRARIRRFVDERLIPLEADRANFDEHENIAPAVLLRLRAEARAEGIWALQMPVALGGGGLTRVGMAACYEEMNRSIFGPVVFNSAAPDDGNMMILEKVGTQAQKDRWLMPIIRGEVQSAFAMTEPDGAGSDPSLTYTKAEPVGNDRWRITGRKWFITGAGAAKHFILMARTSDDERKGLTAFLFHADSPGWHIVRRIAIMGPEEHGGHCELVFDGLEIPDEDRLMGIGDGLKVTQIRLGVARLTHCMRWLGLAKRSLEIAMAHVAQRQSFGKVLLDRESVQGLIGQAAMDIQTGRLLTMHAAWMLDQGSFAKKEVSMAKIVVADALQRSVDTALQLLGAKGYSKDTVIEWIYRYARQARLVDGASEVHRMVIANTLRSEGSGFFAWGGPPHG